MEYIKLKKRNVFKIGILDENDKPKKDKNGHEVFIEFDLEDINTINNYQKCVSLIEKASTNLKIKNANIDKQEDFKDKKDFMSKNQKAKYEALREYYKSCEEAMDLFLGPNGTYKIFGKSRYLGMFDDLTEMLKPIMPKLKMNADDLVNKIKTKYKLDDSEDNILKDE